MYAASLARCIWRINKYYPFDTFIVQIIFELLWHFQLKPKYLLLYKK